MKTDIRQNEFYKNYKEVIEEDWKSALRKGAAVAGIGGAAALGLNSFHNKPIPQPSPTPSRHTAISTPKKFSIADIDARIKSNNLTKAKAEVKPVSTPKAPAKAPTKESNRKELRTIDTIINLIMRHEGLEPKQTPVRITSNKMRQWNHVLGFDIDKDYLHDPARGNFFYLEDPSKVDDLIKAIFKNYVKLPMKYGFYKSPTLKQAIYKFDQTGAKGKIAYIKSKLPTLDINKPLKSFF